MRLSIQRGPRCGVSLLLTALLMGCGSDAVAPLRPLPPAEAAGMYWALSFDHHAITLSTVAPYDTIRLTATPRDATGAPLKGLGTISFRSADPARVQVNADGVIRAGKPGQGIQVFAELTAENVLHADTAFVNVTADPSPSMLARISLEADSARWALGGDGTFLTLLGRPTAIQAIDTLGSAIPGVASYVESSDPSIAGIFQLATGQTYIQPRRPGRVTLIASATAYGVTKADTVPFTITAALFGQVAIRTRPVDIGGSTATVFEPSEITIRSGGTVLWYNNVGHPVDIRFDDPTQVMEKGAVISCGAGDPGGTGDIPDFGDETGAGTGDGAANCRSRRFPVTGVYSYRTSTGATGRIIVTDDVPAT